jgi:F-type H+-transporting ATPase subunit gamma
MQAKEVKRAIESVRNIWKLTGALETLSALKMKKSQKIAILSRPFAEKIAELLEKMESSLKENKSVFCEARASGKILLLPVASDKGFCGSFNHNILKFSEKELQEIKKEGEIELLPVGKKAISFFKNKGYQINHSFFGIGDYAELEDVKKISDFLVKGYLDGKYKKIYLFYADFISSFSQKPKKIRLLPFDVENLETFIKKEEKINLEEQTKYKTDFLIEPSYETLAFEIVPQFLEYLIYQAVLEANASEHSARIMAMRNASDNAREKVVELNLVYNKARQEQITNEVCEVSSAKEVLG